MDTLPITQNGQEPPALTMREEERLILAGYEEARRRDTLALADKWHWKLAALGLLAYCGLATAVSIVLALRPVEMHAPVQLVQVQDGQVVPIGPPQDLMQYTPSDAQWMQMVGDWVMKRRWRGIDVPQAAADLDWLFMHTCKPALDDLRRWEQEEKPLDLGKRKVQVELLAVTKTDVPRAYTVLWSERITDGNKQPDTQRWAGTFTVGRIKLTTPAMALHNRLGLCVTAYNWSQQP